MRYHESENTWQGKTKIDALRAKKANIRAGELLRLASKLEMKPRSSSNSGGHRVYDSGLPHGGHVSIPNHSGTVGKYLAKRILDQLEEEWLAWSEHLRVMGENGYGE